MKLYRISFSIQDEGEQWRWHGTEDRKRPAQTFTI